MRFSIAVRDLIHIPIHGQHCQNVLPVVLLHFPDDRVITHPEPVDVHQLSSLAVNVILAPIEAADRCDTLDRVAAHREIGTVFDLFLLVNQRSLNRLGTRRQRWMISRSLT